MDIVIKDLMPSANAEIKRSDKGGITSFELSLSWEKPTIPDTLTLCFTTECADVYSVWSHGAPYDRSLMPSWRPKITHSRLAAGLPLHQLLSLNGKNRYCVALSDASIPASISTGVSEFGGGMEWKISLFTVKIAPIKEYSVTLRVDTRDIPYYDAVYGVTEWWENECGYTPAYVPEQARLPVNSLWYSYHQQIDVDDMINECRLSKPLGMDTVILDDGWQTADKNLGYSYCGDWELCKEKIPDMKKFVDGVHAAGLKFILWYSVPFMGVHAKNFERFKDMLLDGTGRQGLHYALDPRYPEVREYLISIYEKAAKEWGLDGFKLDFIDSFALKGKSLERDERRDYDSLEEAVDRLMTDVYNTLKSINPEIMIEFRQSYVGPAIRKFGNMLRVADCPMDPIRNRQDIATMRLTSGKTPVHSDMIMWHPDSDAQTVAVHLAAVLYSVPQISVRIATMTEEQKSTLGYYLSFWKEYRDVLLDGKLMATHPECACGTVWTELDGKAVFTCYGGAAVDVSSYREAVLVNSTGAPALIVKGGEGKSFRTVSCMGDVLSEGAIDGRLCEIDVPVGGMVFIK